QICPYAQRVRRARFPRGGANVTRYQIDFRNKPGWYASRVNPASKVPAVAYGNTGSDPENPSSESVKIAESLVLLEFVADLYPDSGLLPRIRLNVRRCASSSTLFRPSCSHPSALSSSGERSRITSSLHWRRPKSCSHLAGSPLGINLRSRTPHWRHFLVVGSCNFVMTWANFRKGPVRGYTKRFSRASALSACRSILQR
ncbi:hypothetical protein B0F90DRAFT_1834512, partial [Multifurca ochricompacta]